MAKPNNSGKRNLGNVIIIGVHIQVIIWQLESTDKWNFTPRHMLIGHTAPVKYVSNNVVMK